MNERGFDIPKDRIAEFCHRHHIVKLAGWRRPSEACGFRWRA
jgi:hypothetical protein